jgi:excisionase family DNA binding protein
MTIQLHNVDDVAAMFQVSTRTIHNMIKRQELTPVRIGTRLLFHPDELSRFAKEGVKPPTGPVNRAKLDSFIASLTTPTSKLRPVLELYRDHLDGKAVEDAGQIADRILDIAGVVIDATATKREAGGTLNEYERKAIRYLGQALAKFSEAA